MGGWHTIRLDGCVPSRPKGDEKARKGPKENGPEGPLSRLNIPYAVCETDHISTGASSRGVSRAHILVLSFRFRYDPYQMLNTQTFCDWITCSQDHEAHISPCDLVLTAKPGQDLCITDGKRVPRQLEGAHFSTVRVWSDGNRVQFSGNPSRFDEPDNLFGIDLDTAKTKVNDILSQAGLPAFTGGPVLTTSAAGSGRSYDQGATFSRIDMTTNLRTGKDQRKVQMWIRERELREQEKVIIGLNTYFGPNSSYRQTRFYDKAKDIRENHLKGTKGPLRTYLSSLADWCQDEGIIRVELENGRKYLHQSGLRRWDEATHETMSRHFETEVRQVMPQMTIETDDLEKIRDPYLGTLLMYINGIDVRERLSRNTFFKHAKVLKEDYGWDIKGTPVRPIRATRHTIILEHAKPPEWYGKLPEPDLKIVGDDEEEANAE